MSYLMQFFFMSRAEQVHKHSTRSEYVLGAAFVGYAHCMRMQTPTRPEKKFAIAPRNVPGMPNIN